MKKQILTLTLCLALTATSALANGTTAVAKKAPVKAASHVTAVSKTTAKTAKKTVPVANKTATPEVTLTPEQLAKKKFEEKMAKDREELYCKLGLSSEQKTKAEALDQQNRADAEPLMAKLHTEKAKLHALKAKKACPLTISKQKNEVKLAKKALKAHFKKSQEAFEALLSKEQLVALKAFKEERKQEHKKCGCDKCGCYHHHHHHCDEITPAAAPTVAPTTPAAPAATKK